MPHEDLQIDPNALDVEWIEHMNHYIKHAKALATAKGHVDFKEIDVARAHETVKVVRSRLITEARENGAKNTSQEEAYYRTNKKHLAAKEDMLEVQELLAHAKQKMYDAEAMVYGMNQRKVALENLVRLLGQEYFSGPIEPRDLSYEMQVKNKRKSASDKVAERKSRRTR